MPCRCGGNAKRKRGALRDGLSVEACNSLKIASAALQGQRNSVSRRFAHTRVRQQKQSGNCPLEAGQHLVIEGRDSHCMSSELSANTGIRCTVRVCTATDLAQLLRASNAEAQFNSNAGHKA